MPFAVNDSAERAIKLDRDGHPPAIALNVDLRDVCVVMVVVIVGQWLQGIDRQGISCSVVALGCSQL